MRKRRYTALLFGILAVAWVGVMFFFSGQSAANSSQLSLKVTRLIFEWFPDMGMGPADFEPILRKIAHFIVFAIEGFLLSFALIGFLGRGRGALVAVGLCALLAVADEYHQTFSIDRSCEFRDMLIDLGGAVTGIAAAVAVVALLAMVGKKSTSRTLK